MAVLVTGANGALGNSYIPILAKTEDDIVRVVRTPSKGKDEVICDLSNHDSVSKIMRKVRPRLICHFAASFYGDIERDLNVNSLSAKWIFDEIIKLKLNCRVIVIGSAAEYGVVSQLDNPISECQLLVPVTPYGITKALQTNLSLYYSLAHGIDVVVARVFNLAIPGLSTRLFYGKVLSFIEAFKSGKQDRFSVGNLDSVRDYIGIQQFANQFSSLIKNGLAGNVYNIGSGVPTTMKDLLYSTLEENGIPFDCVDFSNDNYRRAFDVEKVVADIAKIKKIMQ